jgi:cbb3-type cytochrome oxidase subunit 3
MIKEFLVSHFPLGTAIAGLVAFCLIFGLLVARTYRRSAKGSFDRWARLPLERE